MNKFELPVVKQANTGHTFYRCKNEITISKIKLVPFIAMVKKQAKIVELIKHHKTC